MAAFIDKYVGFCGSKVLAALIAINVAVFLIVWSILLTASFLGVTYNFTMPWLCVPASAAFFLHPWTAITYMVTHFDILHLLFNMLWLYWFGVMLIPTVGEKNFTILYIAGGLAGAFSYIVAALEWPHLAAPGAYLCGASAAVLAIMVAAALIIPDRKIYFFLFGPFKLKWVTLVCIALTFLGFEGGSTGAHTAHLGGLVAGLAIAEYLRSKKSWKQTDSSGEKPAEKKCMPSFSPVMRKVTLRVKRRDGEAVAKAVSGRLSDTDRLDQLLDKIRISGYSSLSSGERNELNAISSRLDKSPSSKQ